MATKWFNSEALLILFNIMLLKGCNKLYNSQRKASCNTNSPASHLDAHKHPFVANKKEPSSIHTLIFHVEGALLRSSSMFPYFMLVAFEAGSFIRAFILFLLYPLVWLIGKDVGLKIMVFVTFVGIKVESFRIGRSVLPKFFLEDVGLEGFESMMRCGEKVAVSDLPRVMVEGFLKYYLGIESVVGRELKVFCGYFVGLMETKKASKLGPNGIIGGDGKSSEGDVIGFGCFNKSLDQLSFIHCKAVYLVDEAEKKTWRVLPREKYPKPIVFHDGRMAFRPTPLATLAMFIWLPFGVILFLIRAILGMLLPYKVSVPLLSLTGMRVIFPKPKPIESSDNNPEGEPKGTLYVCNHRTLFDPLFASIAIMKPLTAVTYSLSKVTELFAPIRTVRLTRKRDKDFKLIQELLSQGDLVICPEGTTCREPYLLRFSPLFVEVCDHIVPMAINFQASMFYATTASGLKCLDPVFLLMNPFVTCTLKILDKVSCGGQGEMSRYHVANHVQRQIARALDFECTNLTRRDKYMFLAGNEGTV